MWRYNVAPQFSRRFVSGEEVRDWRVLNGQHIVLPYDSNGRPVVDTLDNSALRFLWATRTVLANTFMFGGKTKVGIGMNWFEFGQWLPHRFRTPLSITFAFVATHNHFVLDRGGKIFNRSAPIIKLKDDAAEDDHLVLLGLLNSSTACFWMKQTFHNKGGQGINEGLKSEHWEKFIEHTGTGLLRFPVPAEKTLEQSRELDRLVPFSAPWGTLQEGPGLWA